MLLNFNTVSRIIHVCVRQRHPAFLQRSGQRGPAGSAAPRSPGMKRTTSSPITPLASSSGRNRHQTSPGRTPRRHEEEWLRGGLLPALPAPLAPGPPPTTRPATNSSAQSSCGCGRLSRSPTALKTVFSHCSQQGSLPYLTLKVPCLATLAGLALPPGTGLLSSYLVLPWLPISCTLQCCRHSMTDITKAPLLKPERSRGARCWQAQNKEVYFVFQCHLTVTPNVHQKCQCAFLLSSNSTCVLPTPLPRSRNNPNTGLRGKSEHLPTTCPRARGSLHFCVSPPWAPHRHPRSSRGLS